MRKTLKVAKVLESQIRSGGLIPSTREIATDFKVSYKTAYQAVSELVDRKVAYRIKGKGAFASPHNHSNKIKTLGMLWGREGVQKHAQTSITFKEILMAINIQSSVQKLSLCHLVYHDGVEDEIADIDFLLSTSGTWNTPGKQKLLKKIKCPHLYLGDWKPPLPIGSSLCLDTELALEKALDYLIGLGRKNIAIVHHDTDKFLERNIIFARIKAKMELPHHPEWEIFSGKHVNFTGAFKTGIRLGNEIIKNLPEVDGIICISDHVAAGIYSVTEKRKPGLAVMGMDNIEEMGYCPLGEPTLTCIAPDYFELGKQAVEILTSMSGNSDSRSVTYLDCKLKIRKSCGE
jgi:DNA-binding LacI/PurR family transcriptional regulator